MIVCKVPNFEAKKKFKKIQVLERNEQLVDLYILVGIIKKVSGEELCGKSYYSSAGKKKRARNISEN